MTPHPRSSEVFPIHATESSIGIPLPPPIEYPKVKRRGTKGAFGGRKANAPRLNAHRASCIQANAIAKQRADERTYREWFESLNYRDREFALAHGLDKPLSDRECRRPDEPNGEDALDRADSDPVPEGLLRGRHNGKPHICVSSVDDTPVQVENLTPEQVQSASEDFEHALRWALDSEGDEETHRLVEMGRRSATVIACMRPDLAAGMPIRQDMARDFIDSYLDFRASETIDRLIETGRIYSRFLEWMGRGADTAELGERLQLVAYQLRPDLINQPTLEQIGAALNKTRQAGSKKANDLRDTFEGLKALTQRPDVTRILCQIAQQKAA